MCEKLTISREQKISFWISTGSMSARSARVWKKNYTFLDDPSLKLIHRQGVKIASNKASSKVRTFLVNILYPFVNQ